MEDKNLWWYKKTYDSLILKAQQRGLDKLKLEGYYEQHHIIPKSAGGSDKKENLVLLTYREHIIAHKLLIRIYPESKGLRHALISMITPNSTPQRDISEGVKMFSLKELEELRIQSREFLREKNLGKKHSEESKIKMRKAHLGIKASEETKKLLSELRMGHETKPETRDKISKAHLNKIMSEEHKRKLSESHKGRKLSLGNLTAISGKNSNSAKTVIDPQGTVYHTIKDCASEYKITVTTLKNWIKNHPEKGFKLLDNRTSLGKYVLDKSTNVVYKSIKSCAKSINRSDKFVTNICKGLSNNTSFDLCFVDEEYCKKNNISPI